MLYNNYECVLTSINVQFYPVDAFHFCLDGGSRADVEGWNTSGSPFLEHDIGSRLIVTNEIADILFYDVEYDFYR